MNRNFICESISKLFFTFLLVLIHSFLFCQNINKVKVTGSYEIRIETNMTKEDTREKARELAMINAIENEFGTYVGQDADIMLENGKMSYNIIGTTKVRGEWIRTIECKFDEANRKIEGQYGDEYETWITCNIKGIAKRAKPKANIEFQTLNCPDSKCRTTNFFSGESLYLHFKSPENGFLNIFLSDGTTVFRLLPYDYMTDNYLKAVYVTGDKEYLFFSEDNQYFDSEIVDDYELFTLKDKEFNSLYIVFAEDVYAKPMLDNSQVITEYKENYRLPKSLDHENFIDWLSDNRAVMDSFQVRKIKISISKQ